MPGTQPVAAPETKGLAALGAGELFVKRLAQIEDHLPIQ